MLKRFAGHSFLYLFGTILTSGISFLLLPIYARHLNPTDYGILAVCATTVSILTIVAALGADGAIQIFYHQLSALEFRTLLRTIWLWVTIAPLVSIGTLEVLGPVLFDNAFAGVSWYPYLRLAIWIAYFTLIPLVPLQLFRTEQRAATFVAFSVLSALLLSCAILYFVVVRGDGALGSLRGQLLGATVMALVSHAIVIRRCWTWRRPWFVGRYLAESIKVCAPYVPHLLCWWAITASDRWIMGRSVALSDLGVYNIAYNLSTIVLFGGQALSSAYGPIYYQHAGDKEFRGQLARLISGYLLIHTCIALGVSLFAPEILRVMTRPIYYGASGLLPWMAASYWFFAGIYCIAYPVLGYHKRTAWILLITGPPACLNIALNWVFIPHYGVLAAVVNTLLTFMLVATLAVSITRRLDKLPYPWMAIAQMSLIAVVAFYIGYFWLTLADLALALIAKSVLLMLAVLLMSRVAGLSLFGMKTLLKRTPGIAPVAKP